MSRQFFRFFALPSRHPISFSFRPSGQRFFCILGRGLSVGHGRPQGVRRRVAACCLLVVGSVR